MIASDQAPVDRSEPIRVIDIGTDVLVSNAQGLRSTGSRLKMVYARRIAEDRIELRYVIEELPGAGFTVWRCTIGKTAPSLADVWPLLSWDEREIMELYGVTFLGHPDPRPLVLHPTVEGGPVSRVVEEDVSEPGLRAAGVLPEIAGAKLDVQLLPFGPVRAGVVESGAFFFGYVGEHILEYEPQLFFKHRGMEARFEGLPPEAGTVLAERVSAVGSVAHAFAYCRAVEACASCLPPERAQWGRVLLAEMERIYNHLHFLGHLADTTTLKVGQAEGMLLEEQAKRLNARLTGSRFLRNMLTPGGLRRDIDPGDWLAPALAQLRSRTERYTKLLKHSDSFLDRLLTTGPLPSQVAFDQGATGPVARASGLDRDLRRDQPYSAYDRFPPEIAKHDEADAHARFHVRVDEIMASFALLDTLLSRPPQGAVRERCVGAPNSEGLGWVEGARGAMVYAVHLDERACLSRVKIRSPSFSNWRAYPFTVQDSNMMDYAINEASFGLTIAGCDRQEAGMALWTLFGLRQGSATTRWPAPGGDDGQADVLGMPRYHPERCADGCSACADACPTGAIVADPASKLEVDYGRCIACQLCVEACPDGAMTASGDWAFGVRRREDLRWSENGDAPASPAPTAGYRRSLHIRHVDAGSCNGCESELQALNNPIYNLHRLGIFFTPSPRFADLLLVTGPVTNAMIEPLKAAYEAMPEPRWVMATGTCAVSGALTGGGYAAQQGLGDILPVDVWLPGCPPNPAAIIEALLMFLDRMPQRVRGGTYGE